MSLLTRSIPQLTGGVSQQDPSQRLENQLEHQVNCVSSLTEGLTKRPNSELVSNFLINEQDWSYSHVHQIFRDNNEQYTVFVIDGNIKVFDSRTGLDYPITAPNNARSYLDIESGDIASKPFTVITSADTSYVLNKTKPVYRKSSTIELDPTKTRLEVTVTQLETREGARTGYTGYYDISIDGVEVSYRIYTSSPEAIINDIRAYLGSQNAEWDFYTTGNKLYIDIPEADALPVFTDDSTASFFMGRGNYVTESRSILKSKEVDAAIVSIGTVPEGLVFIRQADYNVKYTMTVNGISVAHTTPEATSDQARAGLSIQVILQALSTLLNNVGTDVTASVGTGYIHLIGTEEFTISASDDLNNLAIQAIHREAQLFSDLPPSAPKGFLVKIVGDVGDDGAGYWITFKETGDAGQGHWEESRTATEVHLLDVETMPHVLNRKDAISYVTEDNPRGIYFEFIAAEWNSRLVGDDETTPFPSFVSDWDDESNLPTILKYIHAMTFHRNRLVFTSGESVVQSESGNFFNFFRTTAQVIKDSDRIDTTVISTSVNPIKQAVSAQKELLLYSDKMQYSLNSSDTLAASTVYITPLMSYDVDLNCTPVSAGKTVFFAVNRRRYNGIFESYLADDQHTAYEVTAHCPEFIEGRTRKMVTSGSDDLLLVLPEESSGLPSNKLYAYYYRVQNNERVQSAWSVWEFYAPILDIHVEDSVVYLVLGDGDKINYESISLSEDKVEATLGVPVYLDSREETIDPPTQGQETFTYKGRTFKGYPYKQEVTLSTFYMKDRKGQSIRTGRTQIRNVKVNYADTTEFDVIVKRKARDNLIKSFEGVKVGGLMSKIGTIPTSSGTFPIPVSTRNEYVNIIIQNYSPFNLKIQSIDYEFFYNDRAKR
jgi:hypothetical protein